LLAFLKRKEKEKMEKSKDSFIVSPLSEIENIERVCPKAAQVQAKPMTNEKRALVASVVYSKDNMEKGMNSRK